MRVSARGSAALAARFPTDIPHLLPNTQKEATMSRFTLAVLGTILLACTSLVAGRRRQARPEVFRPSGRRGSLRRDCSLVSRARTGNATSACRISEETLKRYPWTEPGKSAMQGPHYIFNGVWNIKPDGAISVNTDLKDWDNGDVGQRTFSLLLSQTDYYRYSGDPAAIGIITMTADNVAGQLPDAGRPSLAAVLHQLSRPRARLTARPIRTDSSNSTSAPTSAREWSAPTRSPATSAIGRRRSIGPTCSPQHCNLQARRDALAALCQSRGHHFQARKHPNRQRRARLPVPRRRDSNGLPRQGRFAGEGPRRRRQIPSRRAAAEMERHRHVRPLLLGLGQRGLHLRRRQLRMPIHDGPSRRLSQLGERRSQHHVADVLPAQRESRVDGRRLLGRLGVSRSPQLLRQVAPVSDHRDRRGLGPICRSHERALGPKKSPGGK